MSIQEKKSIKGTPFAIIKFSDYQGEFELFLFSENLIKNRSNLKESESFVLTLQKDRTTDDNNKRRVNIKKILSLSEMVRKPYQNISIELKDNYDLKDLKNFLSEKGETNIKIIIPQNGKKIIYTLENTRKFDLNLLRHVKNKEYVKKITF